LQQRILDGQAFGNKNQKFSGTGRTNSRQQGSTQGTHPAASRFTARNGCARFCCVTANPQRQAVGPLQSDPPTFVSPENLQPEHKDSSPCPSAAGAGRERRGAALLKLRKVDMLGFKSFSDKTHLTFSGSGVTCIVGPNGCGKSNIVDAISWVLGEQSHKSLRAQTMSDCIFNGTAKRPPLGLAEVSLTLVDPELAAAAEFVMEKAAQEEEATSHTEDGGDAQGLEGCEQLPVDSAAGAGQAVSDAPAEGGPEGKKPRRKREHKPPIHLKPGEVVIGRRLYRSGQSEYVINGRVARLRDIQEIFMGTGLGPDCYAIIEQGRIGQILSSKPTDRRAIIEEAAGVSKYKTKKRLAEAKLESSKLNLARVNDILVEVEKQLASLKRQASKARRYAEIREQIRGLIRTVLAGKAKDLDAEAERIETCLRETADKEHSQGQGLQELEAEQARLQSRNYELEAELRRNQNLLGQCSLELDRAENRIGFNRQRAQELESRLHLLAGEIQAAASQSAELAEKLRAHRESESAVREEHLRLEQDVAALAASAAGLTADQQAAEARIEDLRRAAGELGETLTGLHGEQAQAEGTLAHHDEDRTRVEEFEQHLRAQVDAQAERTAAACTQLQAAEAEAGRLGRTARDEQARIEQLRAEHREAAVRRDAVRETLANSRARRSTLEQVLNDHTYTADAVQKLFAANGEGESRGFRAVGVLADFAEVQEEHETAVEQFLRDELEYVVVETFDHARAGIAMLREQVGGRATFFVDSINKLNLSPGESPMPFRPEQGVVARLDQLVEFRDPLGPAAKQFLPKLRSAFLVETPAVAESLARAHKEYHFVTPDGSCYHGRLVTGGRPGEAGPLAMKRELRVIEAETAQRQRETEELEARVQWLDEERVRVETAHQQTAAAHVEAEKSLVAAAMARQQRREELERMRQQLAEAAGERARLHAETEAAGARAGELRARYAAALESRGKAEAEIAETTARLAVIRQKLQTALQQLAARREELAAQAERRAAAEALVTRMVEEHGEWVARRESLESQKASLQQESTELAASTTVAEQQRQALAVEKQRLETSRASLEQEWDTARVRAVEVDDALRMSRQSLGDLREERAAHEVERARNESDRNHLRETCLAELNVHPEDLIAQEPALLSGEELAAADTALREMKSRIEAMGPVNMMALEEFKECEQRFEMLSREHADLLQAIADTQQTIQELDEVSRQRFEEAFRVINGHFATAFSTLFGGGHGEMRLTQIEGSDDSGIDIVAQPPGKRLQNVLLLSGGEKALTALSLLIAVFRYQPSPFCILDEVDAPLDEANVGRFARMISEMSAQTQFIIVTHNRRTMEMAPVLYGVTMQEPGVSKLVSVKWEESEPAPVSTAA